MVGEKICKKGLTNAEIGVNSRCEFSFDTDLTLLATCPSTALVTIMVGSKAFSVFWLRRPDEHPPLWSLSSSSNPKTIGKHKSKD